jgi:hypothetical protein
MTERKIRLAVISDLHYRPAPNGSSVLPSACHSGTGVDMMGELIRYLGNERSLQVDGRIADFLICPGDITDKASAVGFDEGWSQLSKLKDVLGASHVVASTGNHEVSSRAGAEHDQEGNSVVELDPLKTVQKHEDYPSTLLCGDARWVYWGRGYYLVEADGVVFLLLNSSHYHGTTRANEFERGRIGDVALSCLRSELKSAVESRRGTHLFVAVLHHHPIQHQDINFDLGKVEMDNGARLMQILGESGVAWIVIHGHKHHPRLQLSQGASSTRSVVFAAGSFGAPLAGRLAMTTRNQFYVMEAGVKDQSVIPGAAGSVRSFHWDFTRWDTSTLRVHGLPDRCGFAVPDVRLETLAEEVSEVLGRRSNSYMRWDELTHQLSELGNVLPGDQDALRRALEARGVKLTYRDERWFPEEAAKS